MKEIYFKELLEEINKATVSKLRKVLINFYNADEFYIKKQNKKILIAKIVNHLNYSDFEDSQYINNSIIKILKNEK